MSEDYMSEDLMSEDNMSYIMSEDYQEVVRRPKEVVKRPKRSSRDQ